MASNYVDKKSLFQVIGALAKYPYLMEQGDKYFFSADDFVETFHKSIFAAIHNLKAQGAKRIEILDIDNYLSSRPTLYRLYNDNKGADYLVEAMKTADIQKFDYYYNRMKKMTLLRMYDNYGIDVKWMYNPDNITDIAARQKQEDWLDNTTLEGIAVTIDERIDEIKAAYVNASEGAGAHAGSGLLELIQRLKEVPEVGIPLYGPLINSITRGARLKKFYLRSAPTGAGKSRMAAADVCNFACDEIYDLHLKRWVKNGTKEPALYISTELEIEEVQTMFLAFLSGVQEDSILNGVYAEGEEERVMYAANLIADSPLWIEQLPDFSLRDIENTIRRHVREGNVKYVAFDYIHTSLKILEEITKRSGGVKLREDNVLFMMAIRIKDLCNELGIFIESSTQLNGEWEDKAEANQNLLRGSKAIADKIDLGMITLPVTKNDLDCLGTILSSGVFPTPNLVHSVYKNRRGKYKSVKLWCSADLGICRVTPMFLTDNNYNLIPIEDIDIIVEKEESAF
jgi:replicative DNA helicase